jgi:hypothetical protein
MDEKRQPQSDPRPDAHADGEISDADLDGVAGGLARIWMGEATLVAGREERVSSAAGA